MMAYEMRMPLPDSANMNRERMYDYADGRSGHPDFMDDRGYQQYSRKGQARRGYDYNHGYQRGGNQQPYRYEPANHELLHRPPESDYYRVHGHDNSHRPPDPDMYHGPAHHDPYDRHPGYDMHSQPPMPDMHNGPPMPDMHNGPPMPDMHNGPPMPDMCNGPPMPDMRNGPPMPDMCNGPPMPDMHNGPPMPDMRNGPPMPDMHNGPPMPDMHNGPPMQVHNGMPMPDRHNMPLPGYAGHGPPRPDMHSGPQPFHGSQNSDYNHGLCGPDVYNGPQGPDGYHGPPPNMGPHGPDLQFRPHGPDNHHGVLGPNVGSGPPNGDMFCRPPGMEIDHGSQGPEAFHPGVPPGVPPPGLCNGPPNMDRFPGHGGFDNHLGMQGPNLPDGRHIPPGLEAHQDRNNPNVIMSDMHPEPPHRDIVHNPPSHEFPPGHPHQSSLYPGLHLHPTTAIPVPPPPTAAYMHVGPVHHIPSVIPYPPVNPSCPPLPQTPPVEERPPTPPYPPPPRPPSPRPPSPRPPSPTSPPPLSPKEAGSTIKRDDVYDPIEAAFSPASSGESPEMNEKQKESIINKYVKHAQKLKSSGNIVQNMKSKESVKPVKISKEPLEGGRPVKVVRDPIKSVKPLKTSRDPVEVVKPIKVIRDPIEGVKPVKMSRDSRKVECDKSKVLEESPARPSLDARLMLMFGANTSEKEAPRIKEKKKSPPKAIREIKGDLKEMCRPLSPPPSPFRSKQLYLYWHKVTLKMRKSSKMTSVDFVSPKVKPIVQKSMPNTGHAKMGPKAIPVVDHAQLGQKSMPNTTHTLVVEKAMSSVGHAQVGKSSSPMEPLKVLMLPLPKNLPTDFPPVCKRNKLEEEVESDCFKANSMVRSVERVHPYKLGSSKGHIIQSSLDSEFELTCEPQTGELMSGIRKVVPKNLCEKDLGLSLEKDMNSQQNHFKSEDVEMLDVGSSGVRNETISLVLSEIIKELKNEIRKELTGKILEKGINRIIEN